MCTALRYDPTNCNSQDLADTDRCCHINIEDDRKVEIEKIITVNPIRPLQLHMNIILQTEPQVITILDNDSKRMS